MKNKLFYNTFFSLAHIGLLLALVACSETATAGGTVDDNAVADYSADEKAIMESKVDSIKHFANTEIADMGNQKIDSSMYWSEIVFSDVGEDYLTIEEENPFFYCYVRIHHMDFGVQIIKSIMNVSEFMQTFFLTANEDGVVYHTKLDNDYYDVTNCEKDLSDFEQACESEGGTLHRHKADCSEKSLHLTCSTSVRHLSDNVEDILDTRAQTMKKLCMEDN